MIKSELVKRLLNKNPHLIQRDVEMITSKIFEKMTDTLENEGRVEIRGFGSLSVRRRKAKNGRNPRTGESVYVPEKKAPIFKSGKGLRDRLNFKA
mgnify:FL=1|tara:strand:+ start:9038 stop:9322 length:285 start_codon:yes stop_codon:yes gene_type:complete